MNLETMLSELAKNIVFHSEVVGDDPMSCLGQFDIVSFLAYAGVGDGPPARFLLPLKGLLSSHFLDEI